MRVFRICLAVFLAGAVYAGTIVSVESTNQNSGSALLASSQYAYGTSWTQAGSYSNVSVSALLFGGVGPGQGVAYLTNSVGTGTTVANEIASTPFSVPFGQPFSAPFHTLFS